MALPAFAAAITAALALVRIADGLPAQVNVTSKQCRAGEECGQDDEINSLLQTKGRANLEADEPATKKKDQEKLCNSSRDGAMQNLSFPVNPSQPPRCRQLQLSRTNEELLNRSAYNTQGEKFPQRPRGAKPPCDGEQSIGGTVQDLSACACQLKLGAEYGFDEDSELATIDYTAKKMAQRMLNVGAYDTVDMCPFGQMGNPQCCQSDSTADHHCWVVKNRPEGSFAVDGSGQAPLLDPTKPEDKSFLMIAAFQGCTGGAKKEPFTDSLWCQLANDYWKVGCRNAKKAARHEPNKRKKRILENLCNQHANASMYVYNLPALADKEAMDADSEIASIAAGRAVPRSGGDKTSIYFSHNKSFLDQKLEVRDEGFGQDAEGNALGEFQWVFHQMHGKGFTCVNARVKMLDRKEEKRLTQKKILTLPRRFQRGMFEKRSDGSGRQWPALLRFAGNRNHTLYDWHDVRVNGFSIKIYDAEDVTGSQGEHRVQFAYVPRSDYGGRGPPKAPEPKTFAYDIPQVPPAGKFFDGDLRQFQNLTTMDFLFIAVRGQYQAGCNENSAECLFNNFPAGGNAVDYQPMFLDGVPREGAVYEPSVTWATWNPLNYTFGTAGAQKLGNDMAMKIMVQPCGKDESSDGVDYWKKITNRVQDPFNPNFRADNINDTLTNSKFEQCMWVQLQENPCRESVENATAHWKSPLRLVGRIYVAQGPAPQYDAKCDNTAFHPYRTLTDHMPLGSIMRIRHAVYSFAQEFRFNINHGMSESQSELEATKLPLTNTVPPPKPIKCPMGFTDEDGEER